MAWQKVARLDALGDGDVIGVEIDGQPVALYRIGDEVFATEGMCTHAEGLLADGWVEDGAIECPLHQARFDIRTGKALCAPATEDLRTYPVKVEGGDVLIDLARPGAAREQASPTPAGPVAAAGNGGGASAQTGDNRESAANGARETSASGNGVLFAGNTCGRANDLTRIPDWVYTDQRHLPARGGAHIPRPHLELRGAGSRGAQCRRFHPLQRGADAGGGGARRGRLHQRVREPLPAPGGRILPRAQRHDQGVRLPLSPMDLQPQRRPDRRAVPARRRRQGRHARGFPHGEPRPAQAVRHHPPRRGVRVLRGQNGAVRRLSRARGAARVRGDLRRPQAEGARPLSPFAARQLEALPREPEGPLSRHAAAHLPGDVRPAGRRQPLADADGHQRAARRDGVRQVGRQGAVQRRQEGDARLQGGHDAARAALHGLRAGVRQPVVRHHVHHLAEPDRPARDEHAGRAPDRADGPARVHHEVDHVRLRGRRRRDDPPPPAPGQPDGAGRLPRAWRTTRRSSSCRTACSASPTASTWSSSIRRRRRAPPTR